MFEVQILVPMWDNDGAAFPQELFDRFEEEAMTQFGGFSRHPNISGGWTNPEGKVFSDCSRVYAVACKDLTEGHSARLLASWAKWTFSQEAIYIRYLGLAETV